ncbi:MAG: hypothetical protein IJV78_06210 [Clostridia bacterium]|nr:hypothetical protein [Clostridia bacterium]
MEKDSFPLFLVDKCTLLRKGIDRKVFFGGKLVQQHLVCKNITEMSDSDKVIALLISRAKCRPALVGPAGAGAPRVVGLAASANARVVG